MADYNKNIIFKNTLKSFIVLFIGSFALVIIITIFSLIGSLTVNNFPILQVIKDNFKLILPLISIIISPLLGWGGFKLKKKRFFKLLTIGVIGNWVAILFVLILWSNFNLNEKRL